MAETDRPCRCRSKIMTTSPKLDHRPVPSRRKADRPSVRRPISRGSPREIDPHHEPVENSNGTSGEDHSGSNGGRAARLSMPKDGPRGLGRAGPAIATVHQLATQIAVATLAHAEQPFLTAGGMLAGRQVEPGDEASTTAESPGIADRCIMAVAMPGPIPGASVRRLQASSSRACLTSFPSRAAILASIWRRCSTCSTRYPHQLAGLALAAHRPDGCDGSGRRPGARSGRARSRR